MELWIRKVTRIEGKSLIFWKFFYSRVAPSALLLKVCYKKQENQAAIFNRFSVDAAKNWIVSKLRYRRIHSLIDR